MKKQTLTKDLLRRMDAWWRAANYLAVGQIYLYDNPLLREPLKPEHIKPRLLGHWGTTPGLNFIYTHLNRIIVEHDVNAAIHFFQRDSVVVGVAAHLRQRVAFNDSFGVGRQHAKSDLVVRVLRERGDFLRREVGEALREIQGRREQD